MTAYGCGDDGMVFGYVFDAEGRASPLDSARAATHVAATGFAWVHLNLAHNGSAATLASSGVVPLEFTQELGRSSRAARIDIEGPTYVPCSTI